MKVIRSKDEVRLLGTTVQDNLSWGAHLETGADALFPQLRKSIGILKHIGKNMPMKSKKLVADGIIMSRMRYMISMWGGTTLRNTEKAQTLVNTIARFITGSNRRTSTINLMKQCGWLTTKEMTTHSSLLLLWKTLRLESPKTMNMKFHLDTDNLLEVIEPRIGHTMNSWRIRTTGLWNNLPDDLRGLMTLPTFKKRTKLWIMEQRDARLLEPD